MIKTFDIIPGVEWIQTQEEFIRIRREKCTGCGNCVKVCLGGCFEIYDKRVRVMSLDTCMECGACWYVCEEDALWFSWPKGGTGFRTRWG